MSNPDSFIDEVTEEVRRDKLFAAFRKWGWIGALGVIVIVGGAAVNEFLGAREAREAQATGDAILAAVESDTTEARTSALDAVPATGDAQAVLGLIKAAESEDPATADALLADIENNAEYPALYRDLATMKRVALADGPMTPAAKLDALEPLSAAGAPFRTLAEEQMALAELEMGDAEAAMARLQALLQDAESTTDLRDRASQIIVALGGTPEMAVTAN
ncbi:hypothetical protein [Maritimibacter sp. DP1N21-5]|uniref:hypothetical protein n=1 Tax=Maritimibacter sp. DP1N21-5 TaxID=2836867 RepID=UPI001C467276|nr:hypothetical protein [Maritimibacter sp. DP1N21-5]MBV7410030.1 hypothetical protein [Maritimibacter sp. DP1N21-5]